MRSLGVRLPILAVTAWAGIGLSVSAMGYRYGETVYVTPTVATFGWPTSYAASASYIVPTSYGYGYSGYLPTSYGYDSVALAPTSYLTTGYAVRRGLFGRLRLVERPVVASYATSYLPTTYFSPTYYSTSYRTSSYLPTVYTPTIYRPTVYEQTAYDYSPTNWESSYVSSRGSDCDQVAWNLSPTPAPPIGYSAPATRSYAISPSEGGSRTVQSESTLPPTIPSSVAPPPADEPPLSSAVQNPSKPSVAADRADSPPAVPVAPRQQSTAQPSGAVQGSTPATSKPAPSTPSSPKPAPPLAPTVDPTEPDLKPAPPIDNPAASRRESLRPSYASRPTSLLQVRNVLMGRVESDAGEPLSEVPVSASNRDNSTIRRVAMTDAFGNFAIRLADGEWTVNVRTPSGRVYPVRSVTVSNGKVMDNQEGREVRNLIISY